LAVSERTVRAWKARALCPHHHRIGRPAHSAERRLAVARAVAKERRVQGAKVGVPSIAAALPDLPLRLVREELAASKKRFRVAGRRMMAARRVSMRVAGRDVLWSLDATHLGRRQNGKEVQAQAVRDVASTRTLSVSVGPPATSEDAVAVLEAAAATRGGRYPLVLVTDNGSPYTGERFERFLEEHGVLHLLSLPHTPRHNPWVERGHRDIKGETGLGKGVRIESRDVVVRQVVAALCRIDGQRLRSGLGFRTAWAADAQMDVPYNERDRARLGEEVRRRTEEGLHDQLSRRARRVLRREAILATLEDMGLITRMRGGLPVTDVKREGLS
jgi:transposase InsO family protein